MGQYWIPVNLDKREFIHPHKLATGLKLWEHLANSPGTGGALIVLTAAMPEVRGGGDFDLEDNWHGPERDDAMAAGEIDGITPGPQTEDYLAVARRTIGRWAGDRIAIVGDYAEDSDLKDSPVPASKIYGLCYEPGDYEPGEEPEGEPFVDITADVCRVIEHELQGEFKGTGWRDFVRSEK